MSNVGNRVSRVPNPASGRTQFANSSAVPERFEIVRDNRAEVFNVTNTPPFNDPNGSFGSPTFGRIASAGNPRDFEVA
jgi:hypothetical protein